MRRQSRIYLLALGLTAAMAVTAAASDRFEISGYSKNYSSAVEPPSIGNDPTGLLNQPTMGTVSNRLRLNGKYDFSDWLLFQASYDFVPRVQDRMLASSYSWLTVLDPSAYRATDLDHRLYPSEGKAVGTFTIGQNLDRAFFTVHVPSFDFYLGRQAIAWGSAHAVNPTDIIAPYSFNELDTEDRVGVDAARIRIPLGFAGEIDAGYVAGKDFEWSRSAAFLRGKTYVWRTDVSGMLIAFRENLLMGLDMTRSVGGAGVWFEGAQVLVGALEEGSRATGEDYFRASMGADYAFGSKTYGFIEYHLNTAGRNDPSRYGDILNTTPYTQGSVYLMGKHYLIPGATYQITPLILAFGQLMYNLSDNSALLAPSVEYNISENIYLSAGAFVGVGSGSKVSADISSNSIPLEIGSEFGLYSDVYYTSFRVYF